MKPTTLAAVSDLTDHLPAGSAARSISHFVVAVALGSAALMLCAPMGSNQWWRHRRSLRARCAHCGRGGTRGAPPLLAFRNAGRWCTDCIRSTDRPQATPATIAVDDGDSPQNIWATTCGTDRIEEVPCHAAA